RATAGCSGCCRAARSTSCSPATSSACSRGNQRSRRRGGDPRRRQRRLLLRHQGRRRLKPPVVEWLTPGQASILARKGAVVVDVRLPAEHAQRSIKDSLNIPLSILREEASEKFDRRQKFVVYCNTGERSAAAFILTR